MAMSQNRIDTISRFHNPGYYFDWWQDTMAEMSYNNSGMRQKYVEGNWLSDYWTVTEDIQNLYYLNFVEMAQRMHSDDTLRIKGIAACAMLMNLPDCILADTSRTDGTDYLRLWRIQNGNLVLVDEGTYDIYSDPVHYFGTTRLYSAEPPLSETRYYSTYEVYFDSIYSMVDSFYVGATSHNQMRDPEKNYLHPYQPAAYISLWCFYTGATWTDYVYPPTPSRWRRQDDVWFDTTLEEYYFVWPILEIDSSTIICPEISGLDATLMAGCLNCTWTGDPGHVQWQISYSTTPGNPDQGTFINSSANYWFHCFDDSATYYIYVRGYCNNEKKWSAWSDSLVYSPQGVNGLQEATQLDKQTRIFPNPATSIVTVTCGYELKQIDIVSAQGQLVATTPQHGYSAAIDVSALPRGTYLLSIHTANGLAAKRLVVQ